MTPQITRFLNRKNVRLAGALAGFASGLASGHAAAAGLIIFRLPSEPLPQALERFAIQARISIGGLPAAGCDGWSRPVAGVMSADTALARLLPPGCRAERLDRRSFVVVAAARPAPAASPPRALPLHAVDELVVTAERRSEPLIGAPFAVSALSGDEIRRMGGRTFQDVLAQFPGVTGTNLGPGRNKIFIRGLSDGSFTGKTQSTVGLYLDDVPLTYDAPDPDLRLADVERVEVLRGPQGTLYGSGSIGGIVRIVTAKPDRATLAGGVTVEGGLTADGGASSGVEARLNLPLGGGAGAVRAVVYRDERGGYMDNSRLGVEDTNYSRRSGGRIAAVAELAVDWDVQASFAHQSINTADTQYTQGSGRLQRQTAFLEPHDNDFTQLAAALTHAGRGADLKLTAAVIDHRLDSRYDASAAFPPAGGGSLLAVDETQRVRLWLAEAQLTSAAGGRVRWLAGVFLSRAYEHDAADLGPPEGRGASPLYSRRDVLLETAAYGEVAYDLTGRLGATVGGRLFANRLDTRVDEPHVAASDAAFSGRRRDRGLAGKLRVNYAWAPDVVVYAQVQDGYRGGGFNLPLSAGAGAFPTAFRPDRLRSYEAGGEASLFGRRLTFRAAVFHADWRNVQTDQFLASGLPITVNVGDASTTGLEAEAVWRPDDRLQVRANLTVDDPQLTRASDLFPAQPDAGLPGVPYQMAAADVRYRWRIRGAEAELSAQATYVGRSNLTFAGEPGGLMGGYGMARVQGAVWRGPWRAEAWIDNLTGERANTFAFGNPFSRSLGPQATPPRPRSLGFSLSRDF